MARLADGIADAQAAQGAAIFLVGEPGVGKSRLVAAIVARAYAEELVVLRGRASAMGATAPLRPFTEALAALSRRGELPGPEILGGYWPLLAQVLSTGAEPVSVGGGSAVGVAEAVLRVLAHVGADAGCLLALEDLHDADDDSLAVLEYLVDNLATFKIAVVATIRSAASPALELVRTMAQRGAGELLDVRALDRQTMGEFTAACLDAAPDEVPDEARAVVWAYSAGNPLIAEELLYAMVDAGQLIPSEDGWRLVADVVREPPPGLVRSIANRASGLGPQGREVLLTAALLGDRFPLPMVQHAVGLDSRTVLRHVRGAVTAQLLVGDDRPDWYAFHHPLIAAALVAQVSAAERQSLSRRLADSVQAERPGLPDEWCQVAAGLREAAGQLRAAASLRAEAGHRALRGGSVKTAVLELRHALRLHRFAAAESQSPAGADGSSELAEVVQHLVRALTDSGEFEQGFALVEEMQLDPVRPDDSRLAALHVHLAYTAHIVGRHQDAIAQLAAAELCLGADRSAAAQAEIDAVNAAIVLDSDRPDRLHRAEALARRALAGLHDGGDPEAACRAWHVLGRIARNRDLDEAGACFGQIAQIGAQRQLPAWHVYGFTGSAGNAWLDTGDTVAMGVAGVLARRLGIVPVALGIDANLILHAVLTGHYVDAEHQLAAALSETMRIRLHRLLPYLLMTRVVSSAHRGHRPGFATALDEFRAAGGESSPEYSLVVGLGAAVLALLEQDRERAWRDLHRLDEDEHGGPGTFCLAGGQGLRLLVAALDRRLPDDVLTARAASTPARMRWNQQFVGLALATVHGRRGAVEQAQHAAESAQVAAQPYPLGGHLGRMLVAESAARDGWGAPEEWLRDAEAFFHDGGVASAAGACRGMLRRLGAPVRQRRQGIDAVPVHLRDLGVSVREYEVYELVREHLGNKQIASRLSISPRTVEKHVASLAGKIGAAGREELIHAAAGGLLMDGHPRNRVRTGRAGTAG